MPLYRYKAVNGAGEIVEGTMDAPTQGAAVRQLSGAGLTPIRADQSKTSVWSRPIRFEWRRKRGPSMASLATFTRELAMLLDAGLPLDRALQAALELGEEGSGWRIDRVIERVRSGATLAHALAAAGGFPPFYSGMVEAGEASGNLEAVLHRLADYLESMAKLAENLKSALIYPSLVAITCLGSLGVFIGFVLPQFEGILIDAGAKVPFGVGAILGTARFVGRWWWLIAIVAVGAFYLARQRLRRPEGRRALDRAILALPLLGALVRKTIAARFARTLGLLLQNGVTLSAALAIARGTMTNTVMRDALDRVAVSVREGKGFAEPLARAAILPELAGQLIKVGEETARLAEILAKVADIYDWEMRRSLDRMLAFLVPGITIVMGVIVAGVVGSILTALFSIYDVAL
jgi:general secretion pathway protein F